MPQYRYHEDLALEEIKNYIDSTYHGHYAKGRKSQTIDSIIDAGHGLGFCVGSILKYAERLGKKEGFNRVDVLKMIHYAIYILYDLDVHQEPEWAQPTQTESSPMTGQVMGVVDTSILIQNETADLYNISGEFVEPMTATPVLKQGD